ncbi:hypothetical protein PRIPAC_78225, partial [Pristionchus pacificus]|uniref:Uncharacterized protein n=1 Tax=Pristionchus pacificus TaxID=54126 RepID=A0A2A6BHV4_PRIPA
ISVTSGYRRQRGALLDSHTLSLLRHSRLTPYFFTLSAPNALEFLSTVMRRRFIPSDKPPVGPRAQRSAQTSKRDSASLPPNRERWSEENRDKLAERIFGRPPPCLFTSIFCAFRRRFVPERRACNIFMSLTFVVSRRMPVNAFIDDLRMIVTFIYAMFLCLPVTIVFICGIGKCANNGWHLTLISGSDCHPPKENGWFRHALTYYVSRKYFLRLQITTTSYSARPPFRVHHPHVLCVVLVHPRILRQRCGFRLSESNYDTALQVLQDRYGQCKLIATNKVDGQLSDFYFTAMKIFRQLDNLQQNPDNYEFGFLLETKLPREVIQEIYSSSDVKPEHVSAKIILSKLQEIVKQIVLVDAIVRNKSFDEINPISIQKESKFKVAQFQFHVNHVATRRNPSCNLCKKKNHTAKHCKKYLHVCDKYNHVLEKKLCIRCFGKHNAEDYYNSMKEEMRRRHNTTEQPRPHSLEPHSPTKAIKRASSSLPPLGATERLIEQDCTRMAEQMFDSRILLLFEMFRRRSPGPCNIFNTLARQESSDHADDSLTVVFLLHALAMIVCAVGVVIALMNTDTVKRSSWRG